MLLWFLLNLHVSNWRLCWEMEAGGFSKFWMSSTTDTNIFISFVGHSKIHTFNRTIKNKSKFIITYTNSKRISSFTELYLSPLWSWRGTARIPVLNSNTGRQVWPPKSSFSVLSYSCTSIRSNASSGTVNGNWNSSSHFGVQSSCMILVFFITESVSTPAIPTWIKCLTFQFVKWSKYVVSMYWMMGIRVNLDIEIWRRIYVKMCSFEIQMPPITHIDFHLQNFSFLINRVYIYHLTVVGLTKKKS